MNDYSCDCPRYIVETWLHSTEEIAETEVQWNEIGVAVGVFVRMSLEEGGRGYVLVRPSTERARVIYEGLSRDGQPSIDKTEKGEVEDE